MRNANFCSKNLFGTNNNMSSPFVLFIVLNLIINPLCLVRADSEDKNDCCSRCKSKTSKGGWSWKSITGGVVGAVATVAAAPVVLSAAGFTAAGITAGSVAASAMAIAGPVAPGSLVALCQSAGAAGLSWASSLLLAATGGGAGVAVTSQLSGSSANDEQDRCVCPCA